MAFQTKKSAYNHSMSFWHEQPYKPEAGKGLCPHYRYCSRDFYRILATKHKIREGYLEQTENKNNDPKVAS